MASIGPMILLLFILPFVLSKRRDGIPRHVHDKLRKAHTFLDIVDKIHITYHPDKTNSHIEKSFPTNAPRQEFRIQSASFLPSGSKRKSQRARIMHGHAAANAPMANSPMDNELNDLHNDFDEHTADHLSLFRSIKQGNDTCQLQSVCVPVPIETDDPQIVIFPKCYEVMQCVGSCCESYESCHPHSIRHVEKPIVELIYVGNDRFMLNKTMNITMEEHTSCSCLDCGADAPQCADGFALGPSCECECINRAERNNCRGRKTWNEEKCTCTCENVLCEHGKYLDRQKCECTSSEVKITDYQSVPLPTEKSPRQEMDIASLPKLKAHVLPKYP